MRALPAVRRTRSKGSALPPAVPASAAAAASARRSVSAAMATAHSRSPEANEASSGVSAAPACGYP